MEIYLVGVSCVGKTTIGKCLADDLHYEFFDLDEEVESYYNLPIERLQAKLLTSKSYRKAIARVLQQLIIEKEGLDYVLALTPSSLMPPCLTVIEQSDAIVVAIEDSPENILNRITFYDVNSNLIEKKLTIRERRLYLREIKLDTTYFGKSFIHADYRVTISNLGIKEAAETIRETIAGDLGVNHVNSLINSAT